MCNSILMIIVTDDQEAAIENLFQFKGWKYDKIETVPLPRVETLCVDHNKIDDKTPSIIHQSFLQPFLERLSQFSNSLKTIDAKQIPNKVNDQPDNALCTSLSHCNNMIEDSVCDLNKENSEACLNTVQLLKNLPISNDQNHSDACKETRQLYVDNNLTTDNQSKCSNECFEKLDICKPENSLDAANGSEDMYKDKSKMAEIQRNKNISLAISHEQTIEIGVCDNNIDNKSNEVNDVGNVVSIDKTVESSKDIEDSSVSYIACKETERTDLNNGIDTLKLTDHSLGNSYVNDDRFQKMDDKLLHDLEIVCKILKNAMQTDCDLKLMLPKLKEILSIGNYLFEKNIQIKGMKTGKRKFEKEYFIDVEGSADVKKEREIVNDLDGIEVKVEKDIINDVEKEKEIEQNDDEDLIEVTKITEGVGNSGKFTKNTKKGTNITMKSCRLEGSSDNGKWIKCEILNCYGGINNTFEERRGVTFLTAKNDNKLNEKSSLKSISKEMGKWKCNKQALLSVQRKRVKEKTKKESSAKFRWTVNRNMRMHRSHRKCLALPADLDSDNYSTIENGYYCPDCQFIFNGKSKFTLHKRLKNGYCLRDCIYCDADEQKDVHRCTKCPKCFQTKEMLERHEEKHVNLRACDFCNAEFYTVNDLKFHVQTVHADITPPTHLCDLCGSKFKERKVLNAHRRFVHSDDRPEACSSCDKRFKTKSQLKNHLVTHKQASELDLSCEICGKMFLRVATLKDHVRRHKKEFSFFCTICNKGFYRKYSLEEHMRVHTGDKPFDCKFCGFKCALSCNLVKHMKIHSQYKLS